MNKTIVAELSKSYVNGQHASNETRTIAEMFEHAIQVNLERGYELRDWRLATALTDVFGTFQRNETIVAVFDRIYSL